MLQSICASILWADVTNGTAAWLEDGHVSARGQGRGPRASRVTLLKDVNVTYLRPHFRPEDVSVITSPTEAETGF
jgi:hypothetical protein